MQQSLSIIVVIVLITGFVLKYLIFKKEVICTDSKRFITSKMILEFAVDIIIIFLGHFISMGITQWDNGVQEKQMAVTMLEEARDFAMEQYDDIQNYLYEFE